ncbi:MAG: DUF3422 family protein [Pseudomonadota bacterium]
MTADTALSMDRFFTNPDRESVLGEMHARPHLSIDAPSTLFHFAFFCDSAFAIDLLAKLTNSAPNPKLRYTSGEFSGFDVKLERHTEFVSCTLRGGQSTTSGDALAVFSDLVGEQSVDLLVAIQIIISDSPIGMLRQTAFGERTYGGAFSGGNEVRTTLKPDETASLLSPCRPRSRPPANWAAASSG